MHQIDKDILPRSTTPPPMPTPLNIPSHQTPSYHPTPSHPVISTSGPPVTPLSSGQPAPLLPTTQDNIQPFVIDETLLQRCMIGCRSRKNLAGRLALTLFNEEERKSRE